MYLNLNEKKEKKTVKLTKLLFQTDIHILQRQLIFTCSEPCTQLNLNL